MTYQQVKKNLLLVESLTDIFGATMREHVRDVSKHK